MFRSFADQYSHPSVMPSLSVSARHGSVPICSSRLFASRSLSWSASELHTSGVPPPPPPPPPPGPSPAPALVTTGERRFGVNLENLPASTRSLRRVGTWRLFEILRRRATEADTVSTSLRVVARRGLTKAVRPSLERKITVFLLRTDLKWRPVIVSTPPTLMRIGWTRVICG